MNKTREIHYPSLNLDVISFVLSARASEQSLNFNILKMAYFDGIVWQVDEVITSQ